MPYTPFHVQVTILTPPPTIKDPVFSNDVLRIDLYTYCQIYLGRRAEDDGHRTRADKRPQPPSLRRGHDQGRSIYNNLTSRCC